MYYKIAYLLLLPLKFLPSFIIYLFSDCLYLFVYYITKYRKKVVISNLQRSFPEKSDKEILIITKKYFHHLCDLIIESLQVAVLSKKQIKKKFLFLNTETELPEKCFISLMPHYGNWEWGASVCLSIPSHEVVSLYQKLNNKKFDSLLYKIRSKFGTILVESRNAFRYILTQKKDNIIYNLISDLTPTAHKIEHQLDFLNQKTPVFLGGEELAKKLGLPVYFSDIRKVKRGHYTFSLIPLVENPKESVGHEITEKFFEKLEEKIKEKPEFWLWSHRRWKNAKQ